MSARHVMAIVVSVIALIMSFIIAAEAKEIEIFTLIALGHLVVGIVGLAVVLAVIPDKK